MSRPTVRDYCERLIAATGRGWNRFWYTPSDPFPLGVMRIATGLVALYVHATYTADIVRFFQRDGLLPVSLDEQLRGAEIVNPSALSYLSYLHTPAELYVAHLLGGVVLVLFTLGLYSRITAVLALVVSLSYVHRGPVATSEIEPVLTMLQFYLCLGPCGACLSLDRWWARRREVPRGLPGTAEIPRYTSAMISLRLIQVHTCLIYLAMGLAKVAGPSALEEIQYWRDPWGAGEAVWLMIARPVSPMVDFTWLHGHPYILAAWSHAIVIFELSFGVLIWNRTMRPLLLAIAVVMWGLLALISGIAPLSILMLIANLAFFSPAYLRSWLGGRAAKAADTVDGRQAAAITT